MMKSRTDKTVPLFSIVVLSYLQRPFLDDCLNSVFEQDYANIELIVFDDCSADFDEAEVVSFIERKKTDGIKKVIVHKSQVHQGKNVSANEAVKVSSGEFFYLLCADDMIHDKGVVSSLVDIICRNQDIDLISGRCHGMSNDGTLLEHYWPDTDTMKRFFSASVNEKLEMLCTDFLTKWYASRAVVWKREFFVSFGGYDEGYRALSEWPLALRAFSKECKALPVSNFIVLYRYGGYYNDPAKRELTFDTLFDEELQRLLNIDLKEIVKQIPSKKVDRKFAAFRSKLSDMKTFEDGWSTWEFSRKLKWKLSHIADWLKAVFFTRCSIESNKMLKAGIIVSLFLIMLYGVGAECWPGVSGNRLWAFLVCLTVFLLLVVVLLKVIYKVVLFISKRAKNE